MSVNTSEEYLDELLQAIEPIIYMNEPVPVPETPKEENVEESGYNTSANLLDNLMEIPMPKMSAENLMVDEVAAVEMMDLPEKPQMMLNEESAPDTDFVEIASENVSMDDLLAALTSEESAEVEEVSMSETDVDAMLSEAVNSENGADIDEYNSTAHDEDVKELLKQFTDDEDLTDINDILERHDNSEAIDEALLQTPDVEVFQLEEGAPDESEEEAAEKSKGILSFFKKRKEKKKEKKKRGRKSGVEEADVVEEIGSIMTPVDGDADVTEPSTDEEIAMLGGLEAGVLGGAPRGNIEVEMEGPVDADQEAFPGLGVDALFEDADMSDIEQLLTGGTFDEVISLRRDGEEDATQKKGAKKESFFSRFINMLMEEDEEEETKKASVPEADATGVTDENIAILDELSKEDKKRAKKERKEQKKKEKEAKKNGKAVEAETGAGEDGEGDNKKAKKAKKVKKEKPRKVVDLDEKPEKKLSRKKVSVIFAFCFSILAMILILQTVLLNLSNLNEARWAFDNADYETCYANLYGEELSEEDELIFQKSYVILCVQRKLDSYENFVQMDMGVEALNALFEGVRVYRDMEERANNLGILDRIYGTYQTLYEKLFGYGLSDSDVEEILNYESKVTYTKRLESIVNGTPFVVEELPADAEDDIAEEEKPQPLEDVLPQEEDFLPEDTSQVNEMNQTEEVEESTSTGNTVVVGSAPVDISGLTEDDENIGGVNVGDGNTDVSVPVNGDDVIVNGL